MTRLGEIFMAITMGVAAVAVLFIQVIDLRLAKRRMKRFLPRAWRRFLGGLK